MLCNIALDHTRQFVPGSTIAHMGFKPYGWYSRLADVPDFTREKKSSTYQWSAQKPANFMVVRKKKTFARKTGCLVFN